VRTFDGRPWRGSVDIVTGGFPCQDISAAGKGAGITGERSGLWKEFARIIGEVGPSHILVENSPALTSRGLGVVLGDLATLGYDARWGVLGAVHAGAPHKRERIWIVANASGRRCGGPGERKNQQPRRAEIIRAGEDAPNTDGERLRPRAERSGRETWPDACGCRARTELANPVEFGGQAGIANQEAGLEGLANQSHDCGAAIPDTDRAGCEQQRWAGPDGPEHSPAECGVWWVSEPGLGRVAHGVANRVDRLTAIGNGQVPRVVQLAWGTLDNAS
jgi:DNA (cytosine-5)-methyltransferase 1